MPALNFSKQFADAVASGKKTQTIRKHRKDRPIKAGDTLYLYTGMRTKDCRKLEEVICTRISHIVLTEQDISLGNTLGGVFCSKSECRAFARDDGFDSLDDFRAWFRDHYSLPFYGVVIGWDKPEQS